MILNDSHPYRIYPSSHPALSEVLKKHMESATEVLGLSPAVAAMSSFFGSLFQRPAIGSCEDLAKEPVNGQESSKPGAFTTVTGSNLFVLVCFGRF